MPDHRLIVARGFRVAGVLIGAPSTIAAVGFGVSAGMAHKEAATPKPEYLDVTTYGIVGLIANAASGLGQGVSLLSGIASAILAMLAVLALVAALLAGLAYVVGRGLKVSAGWARVVGLAMLALMSFNSLVALTFLRGGAGVANGVALALIAYALWVLAFRWRPGP